MLAAECGVVRCLGRPLVRLQTGDTTFSVPLRAAQQVSADFLTLPGSKLSPHRLVNSCSWKSQQDNTQFSGIEARSQGLLAFFLSFYRSVFLSLSFSFLFERHTLLDWWWKKKHYKFSRGLSHPTQILVQEVPHVIVLLSVCLFSCRTVV